MKSLFTYDFPTNTYYASKTTLKKASNPNSAEYKALMKLMRQNPKASVAEKYIKPAIGKDNHKGLTKKFIEAYISIQSNADDLRLQYENATRMGKFSFVRKWLFDVFPNFDMETARDKEYPTKTLLGVLADYFRIAGLFCVVLIVGCLYLIPMVWDATGYFVANIFRCGSAFSYAVFSANILFLWLILIFLVNSLSKSL